MRAHDIPNYLFVLNIRNFKRLILWSVILLLTALLLYLGSWQLKRGQSKQALLDQHAAAIISEPLTNLNVLLDTPSDLSTWQYKPTKLRGQFQHQYTFLLDNQIFEGKVGYHVLTVFQTGVEEEDNTAVLVNRGWIPIGSSRNAKPEIPTPQSHNSGVVINGYLNKGYTNPLIKNPLESPEIQWPLSVQTIDFNLFSNLINQKLLPGIVVLESPHELPLQPIPAPNTWLTPERHYGYAVQWYSLAGLLWLLILINYWRSNGRKKQS